MLILEVCAASLLVVEFPTGVGQYSSDLFDLLLGQLPVHSVNGIPYAWEVCFVVSTPGLWGENHMDELFTPRQLDLHVVRSNCGQRGIDDLLTPPPTSSKFVSKLPIREL